MIGKVMIGKSFRGCLLYCLNDKQQKGQEQPLKDRAEVLLYNKCYGTAKELIQQFAEVRLLNQKVEKPVLHFTLSLAPGEQLGKDKLMEVAEACAKDMGFGNNQYIAVLHKDTHHQHVHLVANRIGFDGRTVSDSNCYKKVALFCRRMEQAYSLQQVQSPRRFQSKQEWQMPRLDQRKEKLKEHIQQSLAASKSYAEFEAKMKALGYQVLKGRGISFLDNKGVKTKGSEIGYSLMRVEQTLAHKHAMELGANHTKSVHSNRSTKEPLKPEASTGKQAGNDLSKNLELLLALEHSPEVVNPPPIKKKRKRQKRSL